MNDGEKKMTKEKYIRLEEIEEYAKQRKIDEQREN
jgi:hypothetical protein